jgi:hypothetical protein
MAFDSASIARNGDYFAHKLEAQKQRNDVLHAVQGDTASILFWSILEVARPFAQGHIPGAWCIPAAEVQEKVGQLPHDKEIVTYCWSHD